MVPYIFLVRIGQGRLVYNLNFGLCLTEWKANYFDTLHLLKSIQRTRVFTPQKKSIRIIKIAHATSILTPISSKMTFKVGTLSRINKTSDWLVRLGLNWKESYFFNLIFRSNLTSLNGLSLWCFLFRKW